MAQAQEQHEHADGYRLINTELETELVFDEWQEAQERLNNAVEEFPELQPDDFRIEPMHENGSGDESDESDETDSETPEFEDRDEPDEPAVEVVDHSEVDQSLPDRELTEDPIAWLQRGEGQLTTEIKGTTVITKKGFRVLQHKYDISTGSEVVVGPEETNHEFARVKAWAEMPDGRRAEAHASAHVDRGDDHYLLTRMADTRAKSRALSDVTGVGAVALEEMLGVDPDDDA